MIAYGQFINDIVGFGSSPSLCSSWSSRSTAEASGPSRRRGDEGLPVLLDGGYTQRRAARTARLDSAATARQRLLTKAA